MAGRLFPFLHVPAVSGSSSRPSDLELEQGSFRPGTSRPWKLSAVAKAAISFLREDQRGKHTKVAVGVWENRLFLK